MPQHPAERVLQRVRVGPGQDRPCRAVPERFGLRIIMSAIGFQEDLVAFPRLPARGKAVVFDIMVRDLDPAVAVGAEGFPVHEDGRFPAGVQVHDDALPFRFRRQRDLPAHPAVFPGVAPGGPGCQRFKGLPERFLRCQTVHGEGRFDRDRPERMIEIFL